MSEQTARNILSALDGQPLRQNVINQDVLELNAREADPAGSAAARAGASAGRANCRQFARKLTKLSLIQERGRELGTGSGVSPFVCCANARRLRP